MLYKNFERLIMPHVKYLVEHGISDGYFETLPDMLQDQEFPDWEILYDAMQYLFGLGKKPEAYKYISHPVPIYQWYSICGRPSSESFYPDKTSRVMHTKLYFGDVNFQIHSRPSSVHSTPEDAYLALLFSYYND